MEPQEIRAQALQCAVTIGGTWHTESAGDIVATARVFEAYITGEDLSGPVSVFGNSLVDTRAVERVSVWGPNCAGCGHAAGVHTSKGCIADGKDPHVYCECTRTEAEATTSPNRAGRCTECTHSFLRHTGSGCTYTSLRNGVRFECGCTRSASETSTP